MLLGILPYVLTNFRRLAMADLLASLEAGFNERTNVGAASRLRNQVVVIDKFMADQRQADFPLSSPNSSSQGPQNSHSLPHTQSLFAQSIPSHGLANTRNSPRHQRNTVNLSSVSDANIDPSLQSTALPQGPATINPSTGAMPGGIYQTVEGAGANAFDYPTSATVPGGVNGMGGINGGAVGDDQFQFQIPPELLEGWPWPFDMPSGGFGGF